MKHEQNYFYKRKLEKGQIMKHFLVKTEDLFIYFFTSWKSVLIMNLVEFHLFWRKYF